MKKGEEKGVEKKRKEKKGKEKKRKEKKREVPYFSFFSEKESGVI